MPAACLFATKGRVRQPLEHASGVPFYAHRANQTTFGQTPEDSIIYSLDRPPIKLEPERMGSPLIACRWKGFGLAVVSFTQHGAASVEGVSCQYKYGICCIYSC